MAKQSAFFFINTSHVFPAINKLAYYIAKHVLLRCVFTNVCFCCGFYTKSFDYWRSYGCFAALAVNRFMGFYCSSMRYRLQGRLARKTKRQTCTVAFLLKNGCVVAFMIWQLAAKKMALKRYIYCTIFGEIEPSCGFSPSKDHFPDLTTRITHNSRWDADFLCALGITYHYRFKF